MRRKEYTRFMPKPGTLLVLAVVLVISGSGEAIADSNPEPEEMEDVDEVLRVLDEAGVPPTREELERFVRDAEGASIPVRSPTKPFPVHGEARWRMARVNGQPLDRYGRLLLTAPWVRLRARYRLYPTGGRETTGTLDLGEGPVEVRVGVVGLAHGFGLLAGAPGRGSSLTADSGLGPPRGRLVSWVGAPDSRAVTGMGATIRLGMWTLQGVGGRPGPVTTEAVPAVRIFRLAGARQGWRLALAGCAHGAGRGVSLTGDRQSGPLLGGFEAMMWRVEPGLPATLGCLGRLGWRLAPGAGVEMLVGLADLPDPPVLASRPAVLPAWSGRGVAMRAMAPVGAGLKLRALVSRGVEWDREGERGREDKHLVDLQASRKVGPRLDIFVRYRRASVARSVWSARFPWEPPVPSGTDTREVVSLQATHEADGLRIRILARTYGLDKDEGSGRRGLISLAGHYRSGSVWRWRLSWSSAWGDPVDLVSAVSPMTGMVLPRHWGSWRSETLLGLEWNRDGGRGVRGAVSMREPEPGPGVAGRKLVTLWLEAGFSW